MEALFVEALGFTEIVEEYFGGDEAYSVFQHALARSPESGRVIAGCGGVRKVRWSDPRRDKGKRGGLRVIYVYIPEARQLALLDVYDKDEAEDLAPEDRAELARLAAVYREAALANWRMKRRRR